MVLYVSLWTAEVPLVNKRMNFEEKFKRGGSHIMNMQLVEQITKKQLRTDIPNFKPGDTLKVYVTIKEGDKSRIQLFEGVCISRRGGGISETFTVRKVSYQVGVERTFPIHSPVIDRIEVVKIGKVRRAKLHYLRGLSGKAARIKEIRK